MGDMKDVEDVDTVGDVRDVEDVEDVVVRDARRVTRQCLKQEIILVYSLEQWMEYNQTTIDTRGSRPARTLREQLNLSELHFSDDSFVFCYIS